MPGRGMRAVAATARGIKQVARDPKFAAVPFFLGTVALEAFHLRKQRQVGGEPTVGYEAKDTAASLSMGVGNLAIGLAASAVLAPIERKVHDRRLIDVGRGPLGWAVALIGWDFLYYWNHRWGHEVRVMWANHVTHHSSEHYNLSTALRQPWSGWMTFWTYLPLPAVGVTPHMHMMSASLNLLYQYWIHTEVIDRMPDAFERVMNTPSHHRVHHGTNPQYLDRNYGGILIIWDRLFGTFEPEDERVVYGLTKNIETFNPIKIGYREFVDIARDVAAADSPGDRVRHTLGRPGWQPAPAA